MRPHYIGIVLVDSTDTMVVLEECGAYLLVTKSLAPEDIRDARWIDKCRCEWYHHRYGGEQ